MNGPNNIRLTIKGRRKNLMASDRRCPIGKMKIINIIEKKTAMAIEVRTAKIKTKQRPRLLSDNGSCYIAAELKEYLKDNHDMNQVHGRPMHQQTQGKIERYHRTMKNVVKLDNYYCPEELIRALEKFVRMYNNERYHESLQNLTPADVYYGRGDSI